MDRATFWSPVAGDEGDLWKVRMKVFCESIKHTWIKALFESVMVCMDKKCFAKCYGVHRQRHFCESVMVCMEKGVFVKVLLRA